MSTEIQDNGKRTVDLVWSKRPKKDCWEGRGRRKKLVVRSLIPTILRDIGPEHPIDFNVSWKKENDEEAAAAAVAAPAPASTPAEAKQSDVGLPAYPYCPLLNYSSPAPESSH